MEKPVFARLLGVLALFCVLAVVMSWPVAASLTSHIAGRGGDPWQTLWRFEYTEQQLTAGAWSYAWQELTGRGEPRLVNLSAWPWMPLHLLLGEPLAYNVIWLLSYVLAGLGMYLLVRWLIREYRIATDHSFVSQNPLRPPYQGEVRALVVREGPAFLAGLMYMFLPYHVAHSFGHFGAMQIQWLPFLVWATLSCAARPRVWKGAVAGILFAVQAWSEHHYALWFGAFVLLYAVYSVSGRRRDARTRWREYAAPAAAFIAMAALLAALPYWPTVRLALQPASPLDLGDEQVIRFSADPFSFVVPAPFHPIAGGVSQKLFHQYFTGNVAEATQYLGLVPLLLVLFFHGRLPGKARRWWFWVAAVFLVISLGPRLHVLGRVLPVPLPYALIQDLPVISSVRAVARASVMAGLAASVLFGLVLAAHVRRAANFVLLGGAVLLEFLFLPVPVQSTAVPAAYAIVRERPGASILELPAATNYDAASRALHGSLIHGKEVVGNFALERAEGVAAVAEARSLPIMRQLLYLRTTHLLEEREELFTQEPVETFADVARYLDVRTVIAHIDSLSAVQTQAVRHFFEDQLGIAAWPVEDVLVYPLDALPAGDGVFAARDAGWQHVGYDPARDSVFAAVPEVAALTLYNIRSASVAVGLAWQVPSADAGRLDLTAPVPLAEQFADEDSVRTVQLHLPPGKTTLVFRHMGEGVSVLQNPRLDVIGEAL